MTWDDIPPGAMLTDLNHVHVKLDKEKTHFMFPRFSSQEIRMNRGMHGDSSFGWSGDKGFFPVGYLY